MISFNYIYDYMNSFKYLEDADLSAGKIGLGFLFFSIWFFVTGMTSALPISSARLLRPDDARNTPLAAAPPLISALT